MRSSPNRYYGQACGRIPRVRWPHDSVLRIGAQRRDTRLRTEGDPFHFYCDSACERAGDARTRLREPASGMTLYRQKEVMHMAVLSVGVGQQFTTLSSAIAASQNGDTIDVQAGTYTNDFAEITDNITIQGVGGMVNLVATAAPPNGKAILTTDGNDTINDVAFSGAAVGDGNGAGIRYQSGDLVLNDDYFHDNQDGLLAAADPQGTLTINDSEFADNGTGDGFTHNLYVNEVGTLTITNSLFTGANGGHEIKSRADNTIIENNRIIDGATAPASYDIDIPDGGNATIENNIIEKGPNASNGAIIHYGGEGGPYANSALTISGNTIVNDLTAHAPIVLLNQTDIVGSITNNQLWGLTPAAFASGPATESGNT